VGEVVIVGAGIAGMTAALRLAQRGHRVAVYERDPEPGGQFRAVRGRGPVRHEHCYHLFDTWYDNFWEIIRELGLLDRFKPLHRVNYIRRHHFKDILELRDVGSFESYLPNLLSGVLPIPDMYLFLYSYIDLLAANLDRTHYRDLVPVNGFLYSRPYVTDRSARMHENLLLKAFGIPTFEESAQSYRKFISLSAGQPSPMFYVMKGDVATQFWQPLAAKLDQLNVEFHYGWELHSITLNDQGKVAQLEFAQLPPAKFAEYLPMTWRPPPQNRQTVAINGNVILAVPPSSITQLMSPALYDMDPQLGRCAKLRTEHMASVHLHLNEKFAARLRAQGFADLPDEPIVLLDSKYSLTVQNNSRLWPNVPPGDTYLHIVASDVREILDLEEPLEFTSHANSGDANGPRLNIAKPTTMIDHILNEVKQYIAFEETDIRENQTAIDRNKKYPIFINDTGAWLNRPTTRTRIPNLFLAGAHCRNTIDVVTIETAVVSGLAAAEAVRAEERQGDPVTILYPSEYPRFYYWPALFAGAPFAAIAKAWSALFDMLYPDSDGGFYADGRSGKSMRRGGPPLCVSRPGSLLLDLYSGIVSLPAALADEVLRTIVGLQPSRRQHHREARPPGKGRGGLDFGRVIDIWCAPYASVAHTWLDICNRVVK
jgi:zeta-carotene desaturase